MMTSLNQPQDFQQRWSRYYAAVDGRPPRDTLLRALECSHDSVSDSSATGIAIDLGCGEGRDTVELLRRGWHVLAIDGESEAIARLLQREDVDLTRLDTRTEKFEDLVLVEHAVDLINASFCLPFCSAEAFPMVWQGIVDALKPEGLFCGHLFGDRDSWASSPKTHHLTRHQVEEYLQPFTLEWFEEEEHPGKTALGEDKYWHIFNIVARKR
jgi:SAM-dependent methyltransferase